MLCCTDLCGSDTTSDRDTIRAFPGQRRLVPTGGNALREYNPDVDDVASKPSSSSSLLLVQVPPGTQPGEVLHIQIPGEDRVIAAQVPPGVSEFQVSYEPSPNPMNDNNNNQPVMNPMTISSTNNNYANSNTPYMMTNNQGYSNQNMTTSSYSSSPQMVLVQVPEGAQPGSMIQVQDPGENRFIMAQVPPGVREFYVTTDQASSSNSQPPTTINSNINRSVVPMNGNRNNTNWNQQDSSRNSNNSNNGFGMVAPILAGAALMGAAGYMMSQHGDSETYDNTAEDFDNDDAGDW